MLRPRDPALWIALLNARQFEIDPAFTLGDLVALVDLPDEVDREVAARVLTWCRSFRPWVAALAEAAPAEAKTETDTEIEYIEVVPRADHVADGADGAHGAYDLWVDAVGRGHMRPDSSDGDDGDGNGGAPGPRESYTLDPGPARLAHVPLRCGSDLTLPAPHEQWMAYARGPLRAWQVGGEVGPCPEEPVAWRGRRRLRLGEFIGAVFDELPSQNRWPDAGETAAETAETIPRTPGPRTLENNEASEEAAR